MSTRLVLRFHCYDAECESRCNFLGKTCKLTLITVTLPLFQSCRLQSLGMLKAQPHGICWKRAWREVLKDGFFEWAVLLSGGSFIRKGRCCSTELNIRTCRLLHYDRLCAGISATWHKHPQLWEWLNLLKPTGHVMHQQFNLYEPCVPYIGRA